MSNLASIVKKIAPALGTALGGPAGGLIASALAAKLNTSDNEDDIITAIQSNPQAAEIIKELESTNRLLIENQTKIDLGQIAVNQEAIKSPSFFVAGARQATIWICNTGLAINYIVSPILQIFGLPVPMIDTNAMLPLLFGLLGIGGMRTAEKFKGIHRNNMKHA